jgi:CheY-like chemotaxis protein
MKLFLVLEDDPVTARMACGAVDKAGFFSLPVTTLADARAALGEWPVDGAMVDLALPDGTGMDFVRELRHLCGDDAPPVLICTADANRATVAEAIAAGANDYAVKPFDLRELSARMRKLVRNVPPNWDRWDAIRQRTELSPKAHSEAVEKLEEAIRTTAASLLPHPDPDAMRGLLREGLRLGHRSLVRLVEELLERGVEKVHDPVERLAREARRGELLRLERRQGVGRVEWRREEATTSAG